MVWVAAGVASAAVTFAAVSQFTGAKAGKKRQAELDRKIAELSAKVATSMQNRGKLADELYKDKLDFADQNVKDMLAYYAEMKLKFNGIYERNSQEATKQYGEQIAQVEKALQEELGISNEVFTEYAKGLDDLYVQERDLIQSDLAYNNQLKAEFKTEADEAIRNTWKNANDARVDLNRLQDSGGRPVYFDQVLSQQAKNFNDVKASIDRNDAMRGRSDLTGKQLTVQMEEAMAKGKATAEMQAQGQQQAQSLRGEITNASNLAMNQSNQRMEAMKTNDGQIMADLANKFGNQKLATIYNQGMQELSMVTDANRSKEQYKNMYDQTMNELQTMLDNGNISLEDFKYAEQKAAGLFKMDAKAENVNYKDNLAREHENMMRSTIGGAQSERSTLKTTVDYGAIGSAGVSAFASTYGGGGFGSGNANKPATPAQPAQPAAPAPTGTGLTPYEKLNGTLGNPNLTNSQKLYGGY